MSHIRDTAQLGYYDDDKNYGSLRLLLKKLYYGVQLGESLMDSTRMQHILS